MLLGLPKSIYYQLVYWWSLHNSVLLDILD